MPEVETRRNLLISSYFYSGKLTGKDTESLRPDFCSYSDLKIPKPMLPKLWDFVDQYNFRKLGKTLDIQIFIWPSKLDFNL